MVRIGNRWNKPEPALVLFFIGRAKGRGDGETDFRFVDEFPHQNIRDRAYVDVLIIHQIESHGRAALFLSDECRADVVLIEGYAQDALDRMCFEYPPDAPTSCTRRPQ